MSAFLGPVHHWMYQKIQFQEELTSQLLSLSKDTKLADNMEKRFQRPDTLPLEKIIDQSNIHGWLHERVERAEERFAAVVGELLKQGNQTDMTELAYNFGKKHNIPAGTESSEAYHMIDNVLLDGMPCDGGRTIVSEDASALMFEYAPNQHALCRQSEQGLELFSSLRAAFLQGMIEGSGLELEVISSTLFRLKKEA